jgi:hypothetical protein
MGNERCEVVASEWWPATRNDWWCVWTHINPELTRAEFDVMYEEMQQGFRLHQLGAALYVDGAVKIDERRREGTER